MKVQCAKCGGFRFSSITFKKASVSFWQRVPKPEHLVLVCRTCGFRDERADLVGKISASGGKP